MAIKGAHGEKNGIAPHLIVRHAEEAMEFYSRALGAVELYRSPLPGGMGLHLHVRIGKTFVMITEEARPSQSHTIDDTIALQSPQSLGGTTAVFEILSTMWTRPIKRPWMREPRPYCRYPIVSGATAMDGCAIPTGTSGLWRQCWRN